MTWKIEKLDEICNVEYGTRVVNKKDGGSKYPVYGGGGATFFMDEYNREDRMVIARFAMSKWCTRFVEGKFFLNDSGLTISPKNREKIEQDFLNYQTLYLNDVIYSLAKGSAQKNLDVPAFRNLKICYPDSLLAQKNIVKILDEAFDKIEMVKKNAEKNLQNSREIFEAYLQNVFSNHGQNWEEKKLKEIGETQTGLTPKTSNKKYYGDFISFITPADVDFLGDGSVRYDNKHISEEGLDVGRKIEKNSILMVCIGATIGKVGFSTQDVSCNQQINTLTPSNKYEAKFFYYNLSTKSFFNKIIKGSSQATLPIINKGKWENLTVSYPKSIVEQKSIVKKLEALSIQTKKLEATYQQKIADLEELKKSVLKKAFAGELNIQEQENSAHIPSPYIRNQVHAAIVGQVSKDGGSTTEVAVAKYDHLLQEVFGMPLGYEFKTHLFGPFDATIKRLASSGFSPSNRWFSKKNGMIISGSNIGALLSRPSNLYRSAQSAMTELSKLNVTKMSAEKVELLSTICHSIKETGSTDIQQVRKFMDQWPTNNNQTKSQKFSFEETTKCLDFILKNKLDQKLR